MGRGLCIVVKFVKESTRTKLKWNTTLRPILTAFRFVLFAVNNVKQGEPWKLTLQEHMAIVSLMYIFPAMKMSILQFHKFLFLNNRQFKVYRCYNNVKWKLADPISVFFILVFIFYKLRVFKLQLEASLPPLLNPKQIQTISNQQKEKLGHQIGHVSLCLNVWQSFTVI